MSGKIIALNTQGFCSEDVNSFVNKHKPMALVVTEHKQSDLNKLDTLDNYNLAAGYPATTKQRGVAVFVKDTTSYIPRPDLDAHAKDKTFEVANVEIPFRNLVLTGQYRSPNSSKTEYNTKLHEFTEYASASNKKHVIAGDFNIDSRKNTTSKSVLQDNGYKFNVKSATQDRGKCLDNFATNFQPEPSRTRVLTNKSMSDHRPIRMELPSTKTTSRTATTKSSTTRTGSSKSSTSRTGRK